MKRSFLIALPLALVIWFVAAPAAQSKLQQPYALCPDSIQHEPLVVYDITGFTFAGTLVHVNMVAYSDGFVTAVASNGGGNDGLQTAFLFPRDVRALRDDLRAAGAFALCDQPLTGADTPLRSLTVFRRKVDAQAHSFSYFVVMGDYVGVEQVIDTFIATHFPGLIL